MPRLPKQQCKHTIFNEHCKSCQRLQAKWYGLLDPKEEIEDVEVKKDKVVYNDKLKTWHSRVFMHRHHPLNITAKEKYYSMASELLHTYKFKNATHRKIWEEHARGLSKNKIVDELAKDKRYRQYKASRILEIINMIKKDLKNE